jgi:hypothetical protein
MGPALLLLWIALTGVVTNPAGAPLANATVTIRNASTGVSTEFQTDSAGRYTAPDLAPGDYEVTATAAGLPPKTERLTVSSATQTLNLTLGGPGAISLGDLGFSPQQTQGNAAEQKRLDRRSHMLKTHQRLGIITAGPLIATLILSSRAGGEKNNPAGSTSSSGRTAHAIFGGVTAGMYFTTASFAIFAPKAPPGTHVRGPIRLHRMLAWVHGSGMILTPILGAMAYHQREQGQKPHGIAGAHGAVAATTAIAYGLAIASVSIKF